MTSPSVANMDVTKSNQVHLGPEFVSVTQNMKNKKVDEGQFLGLESGSSKLKCRLWGSVVIFMCCALIFITALVIYVTSDASPCPMRQDIGLNETWYLRRAEWNAMPPYGIDYLSLPVPYVIIRHTATNYCDERNTCINQMIVTQADYLRQGFLDTGSNFYVGGNGLVFEGRGANVRAEIVRPWDDHSISLTFIGNYSSDETRQEQFDHVNVLLDVLVKDGVLRPDYTLFGHCQVEAHTYSPGLNVISNLLKFPHWNNQNLNDCLIK